ncbi:MAG: HAD-IC family P-type ATPase [Firmicutes bacterium]|nr:HAD-IC family P-type ATPase [Bacillota bacterium]
MKNYHAMEIEEIFSYLKGNQNGLSIEEVHKRFEKYGRNELPKQKTKTAFQIFLEQFVDPIVFILFVTAIISCVIGEWIDAFFIFIVILSDAILGAFQEWKAEKSAESLEQMIAETVIVVRDGKKQEIKKEEITIGDLLYLESGVKVGADVRLIEANHLTCDEAFLTGESIASNKITNALPTNTHLSERENMCYAGSTILSGRGMGIVTEIGVTTEIGKIAHHVLTKESTKSPLVIRMEKFTKQIGYLVIFVALLLTVVLYFGGYAPKEIFFVVVALSISAIPEGLPVSLTIALSIAANKMAKRNVIVKKLNAVESLGSCTVIATDKTGTLTLNQQTAKLIILPDEQEFEVTGIGYHGNGKINPDITTDTQNLILNGVLNNEATLTIQNKSWEHTGDSIDIAFLSLGYKADMIKSSQEKSIIARIPYESENKYSAVFYEDGKKVKVTMKGSLETILDHCTKQTCNQKEVTLEKEKQIALHEKLARLGYRMIALSEKSIGKKDNYDESDLTNMSYLGMVAFIDPLRDDAKAALEECKQAGIKVIMMTGDHPLTAFSIGKELGMVENENQLATGTDIEKKSGLPDKEFDDYIQSIQIFSRVTPMQKLKIIESYKRSGHYIAVTGDGVNDAPALKSASIGIAMGSGTDVSKETSSMIITDDKFSSIVAGIEEGRVAYDNIRKVIYLLISCGVGELLFFILSILFQLPMPLIAIQLLFLNLVTDGIQDVALAFEGKEKDIMKRKPRNPKENIFNRSLIQEVLLSGITIGISVFLLWGYLIRILHMDEIFARSYILMFMVFLQNIHAFNCRSEHQSVFQLSLRKNPWIVFGVLGALGIQILVTECSLTSQLLKITPLPIDDIIQLFFMALPLLFILELYKFLNRRNV